MNTEKLHEALHELEQQQASIEKAITGLRSVIGDLEGVAPQAKRTAGNLRVTSRRTYIDDVEEILKRGGDPMHSNDLTQAVNGLRGVSDIARASLESTLITHQRVKEPRVVRFGPSIWGLAEWQSSPDAVEPSPATSNENEQE